MNMETKLCECGCGERIPKYSIYKIGKYEQKYEKRFVNAGHAVHKYSQSRRKKLSTLRILCACGCGKQIPKYSFYYGKYGCQIHNSKYVKGHFSRKYNPIEVRRRMKETKLCDCGCGIKIKKYCYDKNTIRKYVVGHVNSKYTPLQRGIRAKETKFCDCGCGIKITKYRSDGMIRKYIEGHQKKNYKTSDETKKQQSINIKRALEEKKKLTGSIFDNPEKALKNIIKGTKKYHTGKTVRPESIEKHWSTRRKRHGENGLTRNGCLQFGWEDGIPPKCEGVGKRGYTTVHYWIKRNRPKQGFCDMCGKKTYDIEYANKSGKYNWDMNDWMQLCRKCHHYYDMARKKRCRKR